MKNEKIVTTEQQKRWGIVPANIVAIAANRTSRGVDFGKSTKREIYRGVSGLGSKGYQTNFNKFCKTMDELAKVHNEAKKILEDKIGEVFKANK